MSDQGTPNDPNAPWPGQQQPPAQQPPYGAPPPGWGAPPPPGYGTPPPGWGAPAGYGGYGYAAPQNDGKAIGALISAIAAFVICPFVPAVVALILAGQSARAIRESGGRLTGEGMVTAARVIAWANIVLCVLGVLLFVVVAAVGSTSSNY